MIGGRRGNMDLRLHLSIGNLNLTEGNSPTAKSYD